MQLSHNLPLQFQIASEDLVLEVRELPCWQGSHNTADHTTVKPRPGSHQVGRVLTIPVVPFAVRAQAAILRMTCNACFIPKTSLLQILTSTKSRLQAIRSQNNVRKNQTAQLELPLGCAMKGAVQ